MIACCAVVQRAGRPGVAEATAPTAAIACPGDEIQADRGLVQVESSGSGKRLATPTSTPEGPRGATTGALRRARRRTFEPSYNGCGLRATQTMAMAGAAASVRRPLSSE